MITIRTEKDIEYKRRTGAGPLTLSVLQKAHPYLVELLVGDRLKKGVCNDVWRVLVRNQSATRWVKTGILKRNGKQPSLS